VNGKPSRTLATLVTFGLVGLLGGPFVGAEPTGLGTRICDSQVYTQGAEKTRALDPVYVDQQTRHMAEFYIWSGSEPTTGDEIEQVSIVTCAAWIDGFVRCVEAQLNNPEEAVKCLP
jgi:hypothetical protein